jgi:hypothetical protein
MAAKLTRLTHKIAIQLYLVAESCTICSCHTRRPVRILLDTSPYIVSHNDDWFGGPGVRYWLLRAGARGQLKKYHGQSDNRTEHCIRTSSLLLRCKTGPSSQHNTFPVLSWIYTCEPAFGWTNNKQVNCLSGKLFRNTERTSEMLSVVMDKGNVKLSRNSLELLRKTRIVS